MEKEKISKPQPAKSKLPEEIGGFENKPEPTEHGDWQINGRVSDF